VMEEREEHWTRAGETPLVDTLTSGPVDKGETGLAQRGTGDRMSGGSIS
jgi:hypothetical protein